MNRLTDVRVDELSLCAKAKNKREYLLLKGRLSDFLNRRIEQLISEALPREAIIQRIAARAEVSTQEIDQILSGQVELPPERHLYAFADVLDVSFQGLAALVPMDKGVPTVKIQDLKDRLEKMDGDDVDVAKVAELFGGPEALVKALGDVGGGTGTPAPSASMPSPTVTPATGATAEQLGKALGPEVASYLAELGKAVKLLVEDRENTRREDLRKRANALRSFYPDLDPEKITDAELAPLEKAHGRWVTTLKEVGIFKSMGSVAQGDSGRHKVRDLVGQEVRKRLGREPLSKGEEATAKIQLYQQMPGLLKAVLREERGDRMAVELA